MTIDDVIARFKQVSPVSVHVEMIDGTEKTVAVSNIRRKWARLRETLASLGEWRKMEGRDKKDAVVIVVENEAPEGDDLVDLESLEAHDATDAAVQVAPLLGLMLRAQDVALKRNHDLLKTVFDSQSKLLDAVSQRLTSMERAYESNLDRTQHYAQQWIDAMTELARAQGEGEDGEMTELLKMLPMLLTRGGARNGTKAAPAAPSSAPSSAAG